MGEDVGGITHVGLYVGDNMMIHCGNPITYADLTRSYWQQHEIQKGHIRNVYALRLGYGCYITNESPETYVLYPTWICDCDYIGDPKEKINVSAYNIEKDFNKKYTFKTLVISAQTGEMDDPYLSKKEQIFCPTIITWEDTQ